MIPSLTLCFLDRFCGMVDVYNYIIRVVNILTFISKHTSSYAKKTALGFKKQELFTVLLCWFVFVGSFVGGEMHQTKKTRRISTPKDARTMERVPLYNHCDPLRNYEWIVMWNRHIEPLDESCGESWIASLVKIFGSDLMAVQSAALHCTSSFIIAINVGEYAALQQYYQYNPKLLSH